MLAGAPLASPPLLFALVDHSALGHHSFSWEVGQRRTKPLISFWKRPCKPLHGPPIFFSDYKPPPPRFPLSREGPISWCALLTVPVVPDQDFSRRRTLPNMHRVEHGAPRMALHPLREAVPATPEPPIPTRRSRRQAARPPMPAAILYPPGRPPDRESPSAGLGSSPPVGRG